MISLSRLYASCAYGFMNEGAGQHDEDDDGECDSQRCLDVEELAVEDEACQPEGEVQPVYAFFAVVLLQDEVIRKKDGCHRSEDGSDEVQNSSKLLESS